jgi:pyruvate dehydrogenase E1 component beta subunit
LRTIKPLDWETVFKSVEKTGRLLALDSGFTTGSVAGEIVARVAMEKFSALHVAPARLAMPDVPEPTSVALTRGFYVRAADISIKILSMLGKNIDCVRSDLPEPTPHDVPGDWFKGPF